MIKELLEKLKQRKAKLKDAEEDVRIQKIIEQKQKNANERELESYLEEERQKRIKLDLDKYHKKKQDEFWHGNNLLKNNKRYMDNLPKEKNIFKHKNSIIKTKKMFKI